MKSLILKVLGLVFTRKVAKALDSVAKTPEAVTAVKEVIDAFGIENKVGEQVDADVAFLERDIDGAYVQITVNDTKIEELKVENVDLNTRIGKNKSRKSTALTEKSKWA